MGWQGFRTRVKIEFKDILAVKFTVPFVGFSIYALISTGDYELVSIWSPIIITILGGYFGQGMVREWKTPYSKDSNMPKGDKDIYGKERS